MSEVSPRNPQPPRSSHPRGVKGVLARFRPPPTPLPARIEEILRITKDRHPKADFRGIVRAFQLAQAVHEGQLRKSGEEFIEHPIEVAGILAEEGMDPTTIMAAFLHDAIEDTDLGLDDVREAFGDEVAAIIDGLTKIERIGFRSREQQKAENLRKMIVAMAGDERVLIIKLADRLHNMRTLDALDLEKQELVAAETLEIYAPLAHRLGMQRIRTELEDLGFKTLYPLRYQEIEQMVAQRAPEREKYLNSMIGEIQAKLREVKVRAEVSGRPKHYYSIYEKMVGRGLEFEQIYDVVGVRIVAELIKDCWVALGAVHSLWNPIPGRFKDYIAKPRFNIYQSLHTTVVGPGGKPLEIQIRTKDMHRVAESGIAAHWAYKESPRGKATDEQAAWMQRMVDLQSTEDDSEFLTNLKLDLFRDEVFVFTPKGNVVELPKGATPIDFAYAIHTEVGHATSGARVNGRLVPLDYRLSSGETVEVVTSKNSTGPSRDWLKIVLTPRARTKIRQWFTKEQRDEAVLEGREALMKGLKRAGLPTQKVIADGSLESVAGDMKFPTLEALYLTVGEGRMSAQAVVQRLERLVRPEEEEGEDEIVAAPRIRTKPPAAQGVLVEGVGDVWVRLARCCMPVPGDRIIGFVTRGRGVSVHRDDCPNTGALAAQGERLIEVSWNPNATGIFPVSIDVEALDRPKLLRDVTTAISDFGVNITSAVSAVNGGIANLRFTFEVADPAQLSKIITTVQKIEAVYQARRVTPVRSTNPPSR